MYTLSILFVLFAIANCQTTFNQAGCGRRPRDRSDDKIVGGTQAKAGDWGWQVSLKYNGRHLCGGSIINNRWVLSAAHCLIYGTNPSGYSFDIGMHDRYVPSAGQEHRYVSRIIVNPSYNRNTMVHDAALFKLDSPVTLNGDTIIPVCLQESSRDLTNADSWATGWGADYTGGSSTRHKLQVSKKILSNHECRMSFGSYIDTSSQLCAGRYGLGKDTCQGDSGGPLVVRDPITSLWNLVGITSFGAQNCGDGGVYTRVSSQISWIRNTLAYN